MQIDRQRIFDYIFSKADEVGYMGFDSAASGRFQDALQADPELTRIAGRELDRNYIKDTVLNRYSKLRRYISHEDVTEVLQEIEVEHIEGLKKDLENGIFYINYEGIRVACTSSSYSEWQTVIKRFGKRSFEETRFAFLTCGGIEVAKEETDEVKGILSSYGVKAFIVKPNENPVSIGSLIAPRKAISQSGVLVRISKPFILLAGISGTGKTRFVRQQAELNGLGADGYCLVPVRPDWHEPSDILGYTTRLTGRPEYVVTDVLRFIVKAWRYILENGCSFSDDLVTGPMQCLDNISSFWLCLDEMNLAPVEQYFSDYLSVLETRKWQWADSSFEYRCDPILKASTIRAVDVDKLRSDLDLTGVECDELWEHFLINGVALPFNLIVAGTVNMDETTHGFSRKVIDRALSFDFGEFYPNDFESYFSPELAPKKLAYPIHSSIGGELSGPACDVTWSESINFLNEINFVLSRTPFELAYRALNELLLSIIGFNPSSVEQLQAIWDDFLMSKVLPRIEGDVDKLTKRDSSGTSDVLLALEIVCSTKLRDIWDLDSRPDLHRMNISAPGSDLVISCRSKKKISWMRERLEISGFTSFWP